MYYLTLYRLGALTAQSDFVGQASSVVPLIGSVPSANSLQIVPADSDGHVLSEGAGFQRRKDDDETELFSPKHRTSEFVATVVAAGFGPKAATVAGELVVLTGSKAAISKIESPRQS